MTGQGGAVTERRESEARRARQAAAREPAREEEVGRAPNWGRPPAAGRGGQGARAPGQGCGQWTVSPLTSGMPLRAGVLKVMGSGWWPASGRFAGTWQMGTGREAAGR